MKKMSKKTWTIIGIVIVVAVIAAAVVGLRAKAKNAASGQYKTVKIERGQLTAMVGATGTVRSNQTALLVWQVSGTVDRVNVDVGDTVKSGEVMATLRNTSLPQSIILAQADLVSAQRALDDLLQSKTAAAQARIALREAQEAFDKAQNYRDSLNDKITIERVKIVTEQTPFGPQRVPKIYTQKIDPDQETIDKADERLALAQAQLDDAQREWDRLKNGPNPDDVAAAQARVDAARATLNMARITAPFAGTVTEANPMPGDQVAAGALAFRVDDTSRLLVDVDISEVDINNVEVGQPVTLSFDAVLDKEYHGKVTEVSRVGNSVQGAVNFTVTIELTDADELVKPGMTAAVNIVVKEIKDVLLVPNRAVRFYDGKRYVYVLKDGEPDPVEIRLGSSSDAMSVIVSNNLKEGDLLILNPPTTFQPGQGGRPPFAGGR